MAILIFRDWDNSNSEGRMETWGHLMHNTSKITAWLYMMLWQLTSADKSSESGKLGIFNLFPVGLPTTLLAFTVPACLSTLSSCSCPFHLTESSISQKLLAVFFHILYRKKSFHFLCVFIPVVFSCLILCHWLNISVGTILQAFQNVLEELHQGFR